MSDLCETCEWAWWLKVAMSEGMLRSPNVQCLRCASMTIINDGRTIAHWGCLRDGDRHAVNIEDRLCAVFTPYQPPAERTSDDNG